MRFYFARHGESEANVLRVISNRDLPHGLTDKGRQQARTLAENLKTANIAKVYTSPILRAVQTSAILSLALGVEYEVSDALREYDCGVLEGKGDPQSWKLFQKVRDEWLVHGRWDSRIEQGESLLDMQSRFVPFIEHLRHVHPDDNLLLIGHGGLYICVLPRVLDNVEHSLIAGQRFPNTAYVLAETTTSGLRCIEWCGMGSAYWQKRTTKE